MGRSSDKVNAIAGVAALSALIAALLTVSNLDATISFFSVFASQMPSWTGRAEDILPQLSQINIPLPNIAEGLNVYLIMGLVTVSISSTLAAAKIRR